MWCVCPSQLCLQVLEITADDAAHPLQFVSELGKNRAYVDLGLECLPPDKVPYNSSSLKFWTSEGATGIIPRAQPSRLGLLLARG